MATFTISQTQAGKNLYLYPNGDLATCTEFAAVGDNPNYKCVDEDRLIPDEDTTYVRWNATETALDLYEMQDHTTETGTINYVQIYARGKSHRIAQSIDGVYKIICSPDADCANVYKAADIDLTTGYTTYSKVWGENPDDDAVWEWADIDLLCCGVECSSPSMTGYYTTTLRPNAIGSVEEFNSYLGAGTHWDTVNQHSGWLWATLLSAVWEEETYELDDTTETGTISSIIVSATVNGGDGNSQGKILIDSNGTTEYGTAFLLPLYGGTWSSAEFTTDPDTGVAWTWAGINALQAGVALNPNGESLCAFSEVKVTVYYAKLDVSPEIRTTQCYARVNYNTSGECELNKPEQISTNHARNVKMFNFWSGDREVYDLNRSGKSMVLTGSEQYTDAYKHIICIRDMARIGETITITGLSLDYFNGDYRITSFGWNKISEKPEHYKWILELEDEKL